MGLTNFDELNTLSTTETTKDDRRKATRKKIPIHDYFENMQISEEEKEKRVRLANLLLADVLFFICFIQKKSRYPVPVGDISEKIPFIGEKGNRAGSENAAVYQEGM